MEWPGYASGTSYQYLLFGLGRQTTFMFLLTPADVEITSIQHPKQPKKIPILSYQTRTFCLLSVFSAQQQEEAHAAWRDLTDNEGKACVLLEEPHRFSLWRLVKIKKEMLDPVAPVAYSKACILMIQALYGDVEQLLGAKQSKNFGELLTVGLQKQMKTAGGFGGVLRTNPLAEVPPRWEEDDLSAVLLELHRLGVKFFGRTKFMGRTLSALDVLPENDKTVFLTWLQASLLGNLWLAP
ncbi:MAG: Npun_F0813 family protein [Cyanobacteria bacterium J06629_19]